MTDSAELFKKLAKERTAKKETQALVKPPAREKKVLQPQKQEAPSPEIKKRGRPATGKRSDPDWIGRTYYIRKETDLDIELELLKLKRMEIDLDKSELVDALLAAWVKWRNGENIEILIGEISPRQNG